jgi:hypothetical protein
MPSSDEVERRINGENEAKKAAHAAKEKARRRGAGGAGRVVGNTVEKTKNAKGMIEAEANARRPQTYPQEVSGYAATRPLLTVQAATEAEKAAKER